MNPRIKTKKKQANFKRGKQKKPRINLTQAYQMN
jgi:hypothetical protein